jgi:hypothetical protein
LDWIFNLYVLLLPVLFIPGLIVSVALLVGGILACLRRHWLRLASIVAAPPLALALLAWLSLMGVSPAWVHLQLHKRAHLDKIACECGPNGLRLKVPDWGGMEELWRGLIYDESDEIAYPANQRTADWKERVASRRREDSSRLLDGYYSICEPEDGCHSINVKLVEGHLYLVTEVQCDRN